MSLQERTLVVKNFDPERTTDKLLKELCLQGGPVRKVILRSDHAFVEFDDVESVGYTLALLDGVKLFDRTLAFEPKLRYKKYSKYSTALKEYIAFDMHNRNIGRQRQQQQVQQQQQMQAQVQMQAQMQMQMQSHYQQQQQQMQFQQPQYLPNPNYPLAFQQQPPPSISYRPPQYPPDYQAPQFRNYR